MRYENFFSLHDTVFTSYRIGVLSTRENGMKSIILSVSQWQKLKLYFMCRHKFASTSQTAALT